jgi:hypothetical protein
MAAVVTLGGMCDVFPMGVLYDDHMDIIHPQNHQNARLSTGLISRVILLLTLTAGSMLLTSSLAPVL